MKSGRLVLTFAKTAAEIDSGYEPLPYHMIFECHHAYSFAGSQVYPSERLGLRVEILASQASIQIRFACGTPIPSYKANDVYHTF